MFKGLEDSEVLETSDLNTAEVACFKSKTY